MLKWARREKGCRMGFRVYVEAGRRERIDIMDWAKGGGMHVGGKDPTRNFFKDGQGKKPSRSFELDS
jgi:hypothetical protein